MPFRFRSRAPLALALAAVAALASFLINGDAEAGLVVLVSCTVAVLVAAGLGEAEPAAPAPAAVPSGPADPSFARLVDAIVEPVLIVADNRVTLANTAARALLGQHIVGDDVRLAIRHPAAAERLLAPEAALTDEPIHLVGLGTREQRWELNVRPIGGGQRAVHLTDQTGSYAAERMRVDFVANASHELRTPLASLLGFIETLGDEAGEDPGTRARFLKVMWDEAKRMQRLIDDLISLSRIEAEKYRAPDQSVDLGPLVEEVRAELAATAGARAADLLTEIADVPPVRGDRAQLSQLLHNVIGNAVKYGKAGHPVRIALARDGEAMVRVAVTDEGDGIAPEHLPRLTERFYRVDSGRSRAVGGTGLGLSIVRHIVERHRGRLDIASTLGEGTTVTVLLPVQRLS